MGRNMGKVSAFCRLAIVLAGCMLVAHGQSQPCEPLKPLSGSTLQYKMRDNRCEGLYEADYGAKALALISFTLGEVTYPLKSGIKLAVTAPGQKGTVHVRAVPKPSNIAYEMDALVDAPSTLIWPVDDVLLPENLNAKQIGIYAWKENGPTKVFVPVRVGMSGSATPQNNNVVLSIRPSFDTQVLKWRWARLANGECDVPGKWNDLGQAPVDAGQTVNINLTQVTGPSLHYA